MKTRKLHRNVSALVLLTFFTVAMLVLITGCNKNNDIHNSSSSSKNTSNSSFNNPFEDENNLFKGLEGMGHCAVNAPKDDSGAKMPFHYNGGEIEIEYSVNSEGKARGETVGFLLYVDGIPQPYRIDTKEAQYEYMHFFQLQGEGKKTIFRFIFTPITGKAGETLNLVFTSIYNAGFQPDMKKTTSYGCYHTTTMNEYQLKFDKDTEKINPDTIPKVDALKNVSVRTEPVTNETLELFSNALFEISMEDLDTKVFTKVLYNGTNEKMDNLQISKDETVHIQYYICGVPGSKYKNTFYLNHQAIGSPKEICFESNLAKGTMTVIEADINMSKMQDFNTFYIVYVLKNSDKLPDNGYVAEKTPSILFYK